MTLTQFKVVQKKDGYLFRCPCCNNILILNKNALKRHLKKYPIKENEKK